jgi:hypothetical protein
MVLDSGNCVVTNQYRAAQIAGKNRQTSLDYRCYAATREVAMADFKARWIEL